MRADLVQLAAHAAEPSGQFLLELRDDGLEPLDVTTHGVRQPITARLQLRDDSQVQPLAVDFDDHEARLDRMARRQVLSGADDLVMNDSGAPYVAASSGIETE